MSDELIRALLGGKMRMTRPEPPQLILFDILADMRGISNLRFTDEVREALRDLFTVRIIKEKDAMAAAYATKTKYITLSFEEALKELIR